MPPKVPALSPQEIRDRPRKAIKVGNDTYSYCYGGDKVACAHCGTVSYLIRNSNSKLFSLTNLLFSLIPLLSNWKIEVLEVDGLDAQAPVKQVPRTLPQERHLQWCGH